MVLPLCPHCNIGLERRSSQGVFRYSCPSCFGFMVHFGALKKILELSEVKLLWQTAISPDAPASDVTCPHCLKKTCAVYHGHDVQIELDVCRRCDIVWLDTGEWQDLEKLPKFKRPNAEREQNRIYADALLGMEREKNRPANILGVERSDSSDVHGVQWVTALLGLPTEQDNGYLKVNPWVTGWLIIVCIITSVMAFRNMEQAVAMFGHMASGPRSTQIVTAVTSFFIHGGWLHLLSNMYFLWVFGDNVEDHLGHFQYILLILFSTLCASLLFGRWDPNAATVPVIGASGGIAGVVAFYLCKFPQKKFLWAWWLLWRVYWFKVPAYVIGFLFLLKETMGAYLEMNRMGGGVAHLAHLGGAAVGIFWAYLLAPENEIKRVDKKI